MTTILIDCHALFYRTAYAVPPHIKQGAEFGFLRSLMSLYRYFPNCQIRCIWDSYCTWRKEVYSGYKESDTVEDVTKAELLRRMDVLRVVLSWILPQYKSIGCEADDVIAAFTYLSEGEVVIYSSDTDFQQLVSNKVSILRARQKQDLEHLTLPKICEEWKINHPLDLRWLRAFTGCNSDAVKGCGVPKKELAKICSGVYFQEGHLPWLTELEMIMKRSDQISKGWRVRLENFQKRAIRNYRIMTLSPPRTASHIICEYEPNFNRFYDWCRQAEMSTILSSVITHFGHPLPPGPLEQPQLNCTWASYSMLQQMENEALGEKTNWVTELAQPEESPVVLSGTN